MVDVKNMVIFVSVTVLKAYMDSSYNPYNN